MSTFFIRPEAVHENYLELVEDAHHILHVLRYKIGDSLKVCDGTGAEYDTVIREAKEDKVICEILSVSHAITEPEVQITLFQGLPKSDKMEWILQKNVEVGVTAFVPVRTHRTVVKYDAKKEGQKTQRWQKIVESAAQQSGRGVIPLVENGITVSELCKRISDFDEVLLFYENARETSLKAYLNRRGTMPAKVAILIGPEGGWEPSEVAQLENAGAITCGLGPRILRTETAGMTAAAMILYHFDQM